MIMYNFFLFLKSFGLGIVLAAPVGPIAILCIRHTVTHGFTSGFVIGMGAATADGLYAALASFGMTAIIQFLIEVTPFLKPLGGIVLCYIGLRFLWTKGNKNNVQEINTSSHLKNYSKIVFLTLTNPLTIITFLGIVSALEIQSFSYNAAFIITTGMFLGSAVWHLLLVSCFNIAKTFLNSSYLSLINFLSGVLLASLGISMLIS